MASERFRILFDHRDKEVRSNAEMRLNDLEDMMIQDEEIRRLAEIIRDATPVSEPLLYSSS